jgi:hypothetical protein
MHQQEAQPKTAEPGSLHNILKDREEPFNHAERRQPHRPVLLGKESQDLP